MPSIKLVNVSKRYGKVVALDKVNLEIDDGQYVCVLGPTGSGKTSLLRVIAGLTTPDDGEVYLENVLARGKPPEERGATYMFQNFALFPHMNVWNNTLFGPNAMNRSKQDAEETAGKMLKLVGLFERADAFPSELSGGMQQRVALARGLASGAKILLLDEPLGALDARLRVKMREQLRALVKEQKLTAVHVTHDREEAITISDKLVVLRKGQIEQMGSPQEVYDNPKSIFVANFVAETNFFEGVITGIKDGLSEIRIREGFKIHVRNISHKVGELVVASVKAERTLIKKHFEPSEANSLPGEVTDIRFLGSIVDYTVKLDNGDNVVSSIPILLSPNGFENKIRVIISFLPEDTAIYAYPKRGLTQELGVE